MLYPMTYAGVKTVQETDTKPHVIIYRHRVGIMLLVHMVSTNWSDADIL